MNRSVIRGGFGGETSGAAAGMVEAKADMQSPIVGMQILEVARARTVLVVKRGMSSGHAGVEDELFFRDKAMMLSGEAKRSGWARGSRRR